MLSALRSSPSRPGGLRPALGRVDAPRCCRGAPVGRPGRGGGGGAEGAVLGGEVVWGEDLGRRSGIELMVQVVWEVDLVDLVGLKCAGSGREEDESCAWRLY